MKGSVQAKEILSCTKEEDGEGIFFGYREPAGSEKKNLEIS